MCSEIFQFEFLEAFVVIVCPFSSFFPIIKEIYMYKICCIFVSFYALALYVKNYVFLYTYPVVPHMRSCNTIISWIISRAYWPQVGLPLAWFCSCCYSFFEEPILEDWDTKGSTHLRVQDEGVPSVRRLNLLFLLIYYSKTAT